MFTLSRKTVLFLSCAFLIMCALIVLVYYAYISPTGLRAQRESDIQQVKSEEKAHYTTLEGEDMELTHYDGKLLIVNVWASWSPYTKADHIVLGELKKQFGDRVTIRAVNRKEDKETASAYLDTIGRQDGIEYVIDTTDFLFSTLDGYAMPETLVFDSVGNVSLRKRGTLTYDEIAGETERLLNAE